MFEKMFLVLLVRHRIKEIEIIQHMLEKFKPPSHIHPRSNLLCFMHIYVFFICLISTQPIFVLGGNPTFTAWFILLIQLGLPQ